MKNRKEKASTMLAYLKKTTQQERNQRIESWLSVATPGEVRKHWRKSWGIMPGWATQ
jgi:hypothetical protein